MGKTIIGLGIGALLIGALMITPAAFAAGRYVGGSIGYASVDDPVNFGGTESDLGFKIFGGHRFNDHLALEGFYANFGKPESTVGANTLSFEIFGVGVEAVGIVPVSENVELFGKLGLIVWDEDFQDNGATTFSDSGAGLTYAIGGAYLLNEQLAIRGEYELYAIKDAVGDLDVSLFSVGVQYNFK